MNIERILRFCAIVDHGSLSKASESLFCSQPTLSKQIAALEQELGYPLFDRCGKKLTLNKNGERLYRFGRQLEQDYTQLQSDLYNLNHPHQREVSFGVTNQIGVYLLPPILQDFKEQHPHIPVRFTVDFLPKLLELLTRDVLSFVMAPEHETLLQDHSLVCQPFGCDRLVVVLPPDHPLAGQSAIDPKSLSDCPFLVSQSQSATRAFILSRLEECGVQLHQLQDMYNIEAIKQSVLQGLGISILSTTAVSYEVRSGALKAIPLAGIDLTRTLYLIRKKNRTPSLEDSLFFQSALTGEKRFDTIRHL